MKRCKERKEGLDGFELRVECSKCGKRFDFADYLTTYDEDKHIAELVIEKCGGDRILCDDCRNLVRKTLEKGTFEFVTTNDNTSVADLELRAENGKKSILKFKSAEDNLVTFEVVQQVTVDKK